MLDEDGTHIPILIVGETSESYKSMNCTATSVPEIFSPSWANWRTVPPKKTGIGSSLEKSLIGIFHNLKGYDAVFLQEQMVKEKRRFEFIIPNGTKNLCMQVSKTACVSSPWPYQPSRVPLVFPN